MTDRMFSDCCYGTEAQHLPGEPCPQAKGGFGQGERFTPGPWHVGTSTGRNANHVYVRNDAIAQVYGLPMHTSVQELGEMTGPEWRKGEANVHLIAAAPDLYEALEAVAMAYYALHRSRNIDPEESGALVKARGALAKARGGA